MPQPPYQPATYDGKAPTVPTPGGSPDLVSFTVATLPSVDPAGQMIFVTDETGGATPAFSDGTNWRRTLDNAIVS